ncbi:flavocytochrome c [Saccharibacillus sp. CPCC 101409]|uniref:flavocytochrome c n=1 Tax=Saccharibacillus sp. CPCC 101409 TaxID=3058041 RepID=UPI002671D286|nr:flavocytochrome c [Saccharibacillus sp. CPCC 101409]MDO3413030.1 flavocytochrome c [Saccharibacillus sp. CPCC 101409]
MKRNKTWIVLLMLALSAVLVIAGCGNASTSKTANTESAAEQTETAAGTDKDAQASTDTDKEETEATSGASEISYTPLDQLQDQYDIIVIGGGGAGMTAALEAKAAGMNPVIFEKMPTAGGNTLKSSSGMNASETKFQKEQGIEDSNDKFYEETLKGGHDTNDKEMLRYFVDNSAGAIDWLDAHGITLDNLTITGGMSEKRTHRPTDGSAVGQYLVAGLVKNVQEQEIPLFVNANVKEITQENDTVSGVKVTFNGTDDKNISAKAVIVATGGFGANKEMIKEVRPDLDGYVTTNQEGSTGDGIKMIEALGGTTVDMDQIQVHPTVQQENSYLIGEAVRGEGAILVNADGQRFVNEMDTRDNVTAAITKLDGRAAYLIFDSGVKSRAKAVEQYEKMGFVKTGDSIEALADEMNLPAEQLQTTLGAWNEAVKNKKDADFNRETGMDNDLSAGPYYAIKIGPGIHYTMGGVKINTDTEVVTKDGKAIPGLFAAGEVTGGLHGQNRIGGNSVAEIVIFGREAGVKASEFAKANQ